MKALACSKLFFAAQALACVLNVAAAQAGNNTAVQKDIEASLLKVEKQRADAILGQDIVALRKLMDRYYRHVESRGRVRSKTDLLTALERNEFRFQVYENESTEIQLLSGGKTAVVAGIFKSRQPGRKPFRGRYVRIWVEEPDGWKNTFHQATEIRTDKSECQCQ